MSKTPKAVEEETPTTPEATPVEDAQPNYDDAFNLAAGEEDDTPPPVEDDTPPEDDAGDDALDPPDPDALVEDETPPEGEDETPPAEDETRKNLVAELLKAARERTEKAQQTKTEPEPTPEPEPAAFYTPEEEETLQTYQQDWPDIAKAEQLMRKKEYSELIGYVFEEIAKEIRPMFETVQTLAQEKHLTDLRGQVEDYDDVQDAVEKWAAEQPAYLQQAYKRVIEEGTAEEVADLIQRYKRETGTPEKATTPPPKKETELPPATKKAAAALAPVSSKRTAPAVDLAPEDFESAFATFASKM